MIEVTQADRELLIELISFDSETIDAILAGNAFTWEVEQIARHRIAALEEAATELERQDGHGEWSEAATAIRALRARIAELEAFQQQAIKQVCELAREAGEAKGKLEASELPGIVDGWREKCERLERRVAELEACLEIDPAHPYDGIAARDATIAALEADRAEWVGEREESIRRGARRTPGRFRL